MQLVFLGDLLKLGVARFQGFFFVAKLIESLSFQQHTRVGAGHAGNGQHADQGARDKNVEIMQGNWNFQELPFGVPGNQHDVKTFSQENTPFDRMKLFTAR